MAHLQLQVAVRSDDSRVEGDDASVSALAHHHPALAKEPQSETSRADNDGVSPLIGRFSKKVERIRVDEISDVKEKYGAATACASLLLAWASPPPPPLLVFAA